MSTVLREEDQNRTHVGNGFSMKKRQGINPICSTRRNPIKVQRTTMTIFISKIPIVIVTEVAER